MTQQEYFEAWLRGMKDAKKPRWESAKTKRYINVGALMEQHMPDRIHDVDCEIIEPTQKSNDDQEERSGG